MSDQDKHKPDDDFDIVKVEIVPAVKTYVFEINKRVKLLNQQLHTYLAGYIDSKEIANVIEWEIKKDHLAVKVPKKENQDVKNQA